MGRVAVLAAAAVLVLAAAACGERTEPTGSAAALYPVTVASPSGGKGLVVAKPLRRIAVLSASAKQILHDLGAGRAVVGMPLTQNNNVDVKRLRALRPDLLVGSSTTDDQIDQARRALPAVPVYAAPDDSVRGVEETITDLGVITATQGAATRLVRAIEAKREEVQAHLKNAPPVGVLLATAFFGAFASFQTISDQSLQGDLLRQAGGRNVAGDSTQVDAVQLARLDPRWILATSDSSTTLAKLLKSRVLKKLGALKAGHFATVDARLLQPGANIGDGLLALAKRLHPDAFR
jgi:ABC-type Fe3+-hydroxamate transport system substrate-binding protein